MIITMSQTLSGTRRVLRAGQTYELPDDYAAGLVRRGIAVEQSPATTVPKGKPKTPAGDPPPPPNDPPKGPSVDEQRAAREAELDKLTVAKLKELAKTLKVELAPSDNTKGEILAKLVGAEFPAE